MKNSIFILFILIFGCKPTSNISGNYKAESGNKKYSFNFKTKSYSATQSNGITQKGKFKTVNLSAQKTLIICNDLIYRLNALEPLIEIEETADSIYIGNRKKYSNLGSTVFEIIIDKKDELLFRKTFSNVLYETVGTGKLVKTN